MKFIVTEIGKGNYGLGGTLLTRENLFSLGGGTGGGTTGQIPRIISFNSGYESGFTFHVSAHWWFDNEYTLTKTITLSPSDEMLDRIDVIAVDNMGDIVVIEGIPAFNPTKPDIDPMTQLEGTFVYIAALSDTPSGIETVLIYNENIGGPEEWDASVPSGDPAIVLGSTNTPYSGTVNIEATNIAVNRSVVFRPQSGVNLQDYSQFTYRIKNKAAVVSSELTSTHKIFIQGFNSTGSAVNHFLPLPSSGGYDRFSTDWQFVTLAVPNSTTMTTISELHFINNTPTELGWGFHLDTVQLVKNPNSGQPITEIDPTVPEYTKTLDSAGKLLTELKTVDGSGSGLDADLLDGQDSAYYDHRIPGYITGITSNDGSVTINNSTPGIYDLSVNVTVPTKTSQLINDSGFITLADVVQSDEDHYIDNFTFLTGQSQVFTLTHKPKKVLAISVNGLVQIEPQFTVDFTNGTVEILDPLHNEDTVRVLYSYELTNLEPAFDTNEFYHISGNVQTFTLNHVPNYIMSITVQGQMLAFSQYTVDGVNKNVTINNTLTDNDLVRVTYQYIPVAEGGTAPPPSTPVEPNFYGEEYTWLVGTAQTFSLTHVPKYIVNIAVQGQILSMSQYTLDTTNNQFTVVNELDDNDLVKIIYQY